MKNIEELMSRFSREELNEGIERVKAIMSTSEGQQIRQKLAGMDKRELLKRLTDLDAPSRRGNNKGISNREILDKLNQFCDRK